MTASTGAPRTYSLDVNHAAGLGGSCYGKMDLVGAFPSSSKVTIGASSGPVHAPNVTVAGKFKHRRCEDFRSPEQAQL